MTTHHCDLIDGSPGAAGTDVDPYQRMRDVTPSAGDSYRLRGRPIRTASTNSDWTRLERYMEFKEATLPWLVVHDFDTASAADWTASANVTVNQEASEKTGGLRMLITVAAGFTTGKLAYHDYGAGSEKDFSAFEVVSGICGTNNVAQIKGNLELWLCSDASGDVAVNQIPIGNNSGAIDQNENMQNWHYDYGAALGSSIRSISFHVVTSDPGVPTWYFENFVASKAIGAADSVHHNCVIGRNGSAASQLFEWYAVGAMLDDGKIYLDVSRRTPLDTVANLHLYTGATATGTTTYAVDTMSVLPAKSDVFPVNTTNDVDGFNDVNGTSGSPIVVSGGWNSGFTAQDGLTFYACHNDDGYLYFNDCDYWSFSKLGMHHGNIFYLFGGNGKSLTDCHVAANVNGFYLRGSTFAERDTTITDCSVTGTTAGGIYFFNSIKATIENCVICFNTVNFTGSSIQLDFVVRNSRIEGADDNNFVPASFWYGRVYNTSFDVAGQYCLNAQHNQLYSQNIEFYESSFDNTDHPQGINDLYGGTTYSFGDTFRRLRFHRCNFSANPPGITATAGVDFDEGRYAQFEIFEVNQVADAHLLWQKMFTIETDAVEVDGADSRSWRLSCTDTSLSANHPARMELGRYFCEGGVSKTLTFRVKRSDTGLTVDLHIDGLEGYDPGQADIVANLSAAADTWADLAVTWTPDQDTVVLPELRAFGGTTYFANVGLTDPN